MGTVVNLRQARKAKARTDAAQAAETNRARFGRSKAEMAEAAARETLAVRHLDGHRRELPEGDA